MADLIALRQRGLAAYCVTDASGVALNGSLTLNQIRAAGMAPICQVDHNGVENGGSTSAALLRARGLKTFCQVNESGVDPVSSDTQNQLLARGVLGMCVLDVNGVAQSGTQTSAQLWARGIRSFVPVDQTGTEIALGGISLSGLTVPDGSSVNTTVGTASISGSFTGTAVWAISDADTTFKINSSTGVVQVNNNTDLNYLTHPTITVTISVSGTTPSFSNLVTAITVTHAPVNSVAPAIAGNAVEGATLTLTRGTWTGNPTPALTDQWKQGSTPITGETSLTYLVRNGDVGSTLKVTESAINTISTVTQDSSATATVTRNTISYAPTTSATQSVAYTGATPSSSGGTAPYSYSLTGSLPPGLTCPSTGIITGTPTTLGTYSGLVLKSTDANGIVDSSASFSITVSAAAGGTAGQPIGLLLALTKAA